METAVIRLQAAEEVKEFVREASKCDFDVDIWYNRIVVDAKSLLGVLSLDLSRNLFVSCRGYDPAFEYTLKKYSVA